jgi:serine/threonine-protein kinase
VPATVIDPAGRTAVPAGTQAQPAGNRKPKRVRHLALLAAAIVAVVAAAGGWLLARDVSDTGTAQPGQGSGASSQHAPASPGGQATTPTVPVVSTVDVDGAALDGLPAQQAARQLRQLGLTVRVVLVPSLAQAPGTVLDVEPSGQVQPGSTVVLDTAVSPARLRHHGGNGADGD